MNDKTRARLLSILDNEANRDIRYEKGTFHGEKVVRIHYVDKEGVKCTVTINQ